MKKIGFEDFDTMHEEEFEILAKVVAKIKNHLEYNEEIEKFLKHLNVHFFQEIELMEKYNYPLTPNHNQEHIKIIGEIERMLDKSPDELLEFIKNRLIPLMEEHIQTFDKIMADYLKEAIKDEEFYQEK